MWMSHVTCISTTRWVVSSDTKEKERAINLCIGNGEDPQDAWSCRSFSAKEPLIIGLFCGQNPMEIKHLMGLCHSVMYKRVMSCMQLNKMNESHHTYRTNESHHTYRTNESHHTYRTHAWVVAHMQMSHVTRTVEHKGKDLRRLRLFTSNNDHMNGDYST